ncbi:hypothetical protein [Klebsiella oxytoca]
MTWRGDAFPEAALRTCPGYGLAGTIIWRGDVFPGGAARRLRE